MGKEFHRSGRDMKLIVSYAEKKTSALCAQFLAI